MRLCCMCHELKPETAFAFRTIATGVRQDHCRVCHAAYRRQHYLDNRALYIRREVARMKAYRLGNRERILAYLRAHACVDCAEADPVVLDFDHRDLSTKRSEVGRLAMTKPWWMVAAEIAKCDVRCGNCHRRRTASQFGWADNARRAEGVAPVREKVEANPAYLTLLGAEMHEVRVCTGCQEEKPIAEFSVKNWKTGTRVRRCHACIAAVSRAHYWRDPQAYVAKARVNRQKNRNRNRVNKARLLESLACLDCGQRDPVVLEFDHRDADLKVASVSRMSATHSWATVLTEVAKCDVRCVNCHRRRTARQFGWGQHQLSEDAVAA